MTSQEGCRFGWKRKIGADVLKSVSTVFESESKDEEDEMVKNGDIDWLTLLPNKKQVIGLEDPKSKAERLLQEGMTLAESERYWEALGKWEDALQYKPYESRIHEMRSQAFLELGEVYPAVHAAKKAVQYSSNWWVAHQTLGRALLGLGEVRQAVRSFSKAVHLNPVDQELREEDLKWAWSLLQKHQALEKERKEAQDMKTATKSSVKIKEIPDKNESIYDEDEDKSESENEVKTVDIYQCDLKSAEKTTKTSSNRIQKRERQNAPNLTRNYIQMRDNL